jgi:hypothetical protein
VETSCLPTGAGKREGAPFFRRRRVEKCNVRTVSAGEKYCRDWPHPHVIMLLGGAKRNMDSQCVVDLKFVTYFAACSPTNFKSGIEL